MSFAQLLKSTTDLICFDLDWTLVKPITGDAKNPRFREFAWDWQEIPGRTAVIHQLRAEHIQLAIVTNQGGVAFGIYQPQEMVKEIWEAASCFSIYFCHFCFDHPKGSRRRFRRDSPFRAPHPGLLRRAMQDADAIPHRTLMVSDRDEDRLAARNAGCRFIDATAFFAQFTELPSEDHTA